MNRQHVALLLASAVVLGACGGGTAAPSTDGGASTAPTAAPPSDAAPTDDAQVTTMDPGQPGTGPVDLCAVLSMAEVGAATGAEVAVAVAGPEVAGLSSCNYNAADGSPVAGVTLTTSAYTVEPKAFFEANASAAGATELPGLGDAAVLVGESDFPMAFVLMGDRLLAVSALAGPSDGNGRRDATVELTTALVAALR